MLVCFVCIIWATDSDSSDSDMQKRSAKNVMTSVISQQLYSIPGEYMMCYSTVRFK